MSTQPQGTTRSQRDPDMEGAETAMHRAAQRARQRAAEAAIAVSPTAPQEGRAVHESLQVLRDAGLNESAAHLRYASDCINAGDWSGSVRESIHAVESVARQLDPEAATTLAPALKSLERHAALHPAIKDAFSKLYGYTSDQQGIRHALLDRTDARVGQDEAVFMLGACASFASYLWRKYAAGKSS